jgi:phosphoenolpyruvate-protein kinase (PTS system EI component)
MFPMVSTLEEVLLLRSIWGEVQSALKKSDASFDEQVQFGIMVEVPSLVAIVDRLAREVGIQSICSVKDTIRKTDAASAAALAAACLRLDSADEVRGCLAAGRI